MRNYVLYNQDQPVARFSVETGVIASYAPTRPELLPMQIHAASPEGFTLWLQNRAMDLSSFQHRQLAQALVGSRDKISVALLTHMFSISDTFTCFATDEPFVSRSQLCLPDQQNRVSDFILVSSDTSLRLARISSPNASTDGSFTKTWRFENNHWWLYKLQSADATRSEYEISRALRKAGFDAAEYRMDHSRKTRIRTRNFVGEDEFFEPYESLRYMFKDLSDSDDVIYANLASLGEAFEHAWRRILLSDALFMNTDRHMRNFGGIRSARTGELKRLAPNFDNNQAYKANPGNHYSSGMLNAFRAAYGLTQADRDELRALLSACEERAYMQDAVEVGTDFLKQINEN